MDLREKCFVFYGADYPGFYKDAEAFEFHPDRICYLSENSLDCLMSQKDWKEIPRERLIKEFDAETAETIREKVRCKLEKEGCPGKTDEGFIGFLTKNLFSSLQWACVETLLDINPEAEYRYYFARKGECITTVRLTKPVREISGNQILAARRILTDNGVDADEADYVLQALGYALLDVELFSEKI